jgi:hypothetical protein
MGQDKGFDLCRQIVSEFYWTNYKTFYLLNCNLGLKSEVSAVEFPSPPPPKISQRTTVRSGNCHCLNDYVLGRWLSAFCFHNHAFRMTTQCWYFQQSPFISLVILLSGFCPVVL